MQKDAFGGREMPHKQGSARGAGTHPKFVGRHAQAFQLLRLDGSCVHAILSVQELDHAAIGCPHSAIIPTNIMEWLRPAHSAQEKAYYEAGTRTQTGGWPVISCWRNSEIGKASASTSMPQGNLSILPIICSYMCGCDQRNGDSSMSGRWWRT